MVVGPAEGRRVHLHDQGLVLVLPLLGILVVLDVVQTNNIEKIRE